MTSTIQPPYLRHALESGLAKLVGEGKAERIHYVAADHSERWSDPEEKVRAEFWAELIYKYEYRVERIRFEVKVPRRTPNDLADLVIYGDKDNELKAPYLVFECKRADISDAEFAQSVEQACGNRANLAAPFCGEHFNERVMRMTAKNSVDSVRMSMITEMPVMVPLLAEQKRISCCLSSLNDLIAAQINKLEALKTHKKGLMQQLFPSPMEIGA